MICISASCDSFGSRMRAMAAWATSTRLCDGISVAMATAMPEAPLSRIIGSRAGSSSGSVAEPS